MFNYSVDDFEIQKFFSYTTTIPCNKTLVDIDHYYDIEKFPNIIGKFNDFFESLINKATKMYEEATGNECGYFKFKDNKTVFQIKHKYTGKIYFIGKYDFRRAIGTECYLYDGRIFDFTKMVETDYVSDVIGNARGLWKKFEF